LDPNSCIGTFCSLWIKGEEIGCNFSDRDYFFIYTIGRIEGVESAGLRGRRCKFLDRHFLSQRNDERPSIRYPPIRYTSIRYPIQFATFVSIRYPCFNSLPNAKLSDFSIFKRKNWFKWY
jgi:hypothetical protein